MKAIFSILYLLLAVVILIPAFTIGFVYEEIRVFITMGRFAAARVAIGFSRKNGR